jgi:hypothetical protein
MYALLLAGILLIVNLVGTTPRDQIDQLSYSQVLTLIEEDKVSNVMTSGTTLVLRYTDSSIPESEFGTRYDAMPDTGAVPLVALLRRRQRHLRRAAGQGRQSDQHGGLRFHGGRAGAAGNAVVGRMVAAACDVYTVRAFVVFPSAPADRQQQGRHELWEKPRASLRPEQEKGHVRRRRRRG